MTASVRLDDYVVPAAGPARLRGELSYVPVEPAWMDEPAIGSRPRDEPGLESITFEEFLNEPEPAHTELVTGLGIPDVGVTVLAGPPKSLKTMLAGQLALCLSSGVPFLGSTIARGGPVLFVEEEGNRHRLRERFRRQAEGLGAVAPAIDLRLFNGVRLDSPAWITRLTAAIGSQRYALVVFDPFSWLHGADENKPTAMAPIMRTLNRLAQSGGTSILAIHHVTKPQADRPQGRLGDRIRGASTITAGVDALFVLDRVGDRRARLQSDARDAESVDIGLELDVETLLLSSVDVPRAAGKIDPAELVAFVTERGQVTAQDVMKRFGVVKNTALKELDANPDLDSFEGARRQRTYLLRTVQ